MENEANEVVSFWCVKCHQPSQVSTTSETTDMVLDMARHGTLMCDACFRTASLRIVAMVNKLFPEVG